MTSPVAMTLEDSMTMMFMVPRSIKKDELPEPNQNQIEFREEPDKRVAAIKFGGWASAKKIEKYKSRLVRALQAEGIPHTEKYY